MTDTYIFTNKKNGLKCVIIQVDKESKEIQIKYLISERKYWYSEEEFDKKFYS